MAVIKRFRRTCRLGLALKLSMFASIALAEPIEADLGDGLHYHRAPQLPADLPPPPDKPTALVLDLRYAAANADAATALEAWLKFRATPAAPVLVLINADTAAVLRPVLAAQQGNPGVLTIGATQPEFTPDIAIKTSPETERRAYDALQKGGNVHTLIAANVEKARVDEASIVRGRANLPGEPDADDAFALSDEVPAPPAPPSRPPVDVALERAVQVHRALRALGRL